MSLFFLFFVLKNILLNVCTLQYHNCSFKKNMQTGLKSTVPSITSVDLSGNGASHYSGSQSHVSGHGVSIAIYAW